jgi:hypothetical protein
VQHKLSPGGWVVLVSGALIFLASFLPFYEISFPGVSLSTTAWDSGNFLLTALPAILGGLMAAQLALVTFARFEMNDRVLGMTWVQFHVAVALQVLVMMVAFAVRDTTGGFDRGTGLFGMLLAAVGLFVGALMRRREARTAY